MRNLTKVMRAEWISIVGQYNVVVRTLCGYSVY